jgi:tetratricopeptide (TPR) repeat protein
MNATLPPSAARRELFAQHPGTGVGPPRPDLRGGALGPIAARAPAARHGSVAAIGEQEAARKTAAAVVERPAAAEPASSGTAAADAILGRGQAAFDHGDYPEALRRGREAIAAGGALGGHLLAGDAYYRLERFPDALREYQAALALDPGNASIKRRRDLAEKGAAQ